MHGTQLITQLLNEDRMSHTENNLKFHSGFCMICTSPTGKTQHIFMHTYMELIFVACAVLHRLTCWHALFGHGMYNCQWQPVYVRIKCCSNMSTHVQFFMQRHIWQLNIKYMVNSIVMHRSARQFPLCFCVWKHTCYVCLAWSSFSVINVSLLQ